MSICVDAARRRFGRLQRTRAIAESRDTRGPNIPNRGRVAKANAFDAGNLERLRRLRELLNPHGHTFTC